MSQIKIALDAGHGGSDPGATYKGRQEKDDTLRLVQAVGKILEDNGIDVFYIRTDDIYETPFKKASDANNAGADYFVSIHRNSSERENQYSGVETLVFDDSGIKAQMARNVNNALEAAGFQNLGVDARPNLVVLKRTRMPSILIEAGFINNDKDNATFDNNFNKIAEAIADGILETIYQNTASGSRITSIDDFMGGVDQPLVSPPDSPPDYTPEENMSPYPADNAFEETVTNNTNPQPRENTGFPESNNNLRNWYPYENTQTIPNYTQQPVGTQEDSRDEPLYRVQVGAYKNKDNADRMLNSLLIEGFPAFIIYEDDLYKVQVGAFVQLYNAVKMERRLRRFRYNTFIVYA